MIIFPKNNLVILLCIPRYLIHPSNQWTLNRVDHQLKPKVKSFFLNNAAVSGMILIAMIHLFFSGLAQYRSNL